MADNEEWAKLLHDHPIFSLPVSYEQLPKAKNLLELSTNTLPDFTNSNPHWQEDPLAPSGRRQTMILKDSDLIVAVGKEIRMSSFGDLKLSRSIRKSYKTLHTPNVQFEIHQIALNPTGKLLAIAGAFQIAVIVLPRPGYSRLVPDALDCKAIQIGQFYHASDNSAPLAKIEWHPWGEAGSTLLVMTVDGKLREYDISNDTEEPQQVVSFVPEKKSKSFLGVDKSEREVASFTFGQGRADWGPLTIYAVMKSGDIYCVCPYMPQNASIPSAYLHSLECFISAKQEFLRAAPATSRTLSTIYDYQHKYITALVKQLPPGIVFPAVSKFVSVHPPTTIKSTPLRQGPFLLQPSPRTLQDSEGGDATDITYLAFRAGFIDNEDGVPDTEHLGIILVSFQDGKVDLFLDVDKVEAQWDNKQVIPNRDLPMLAVYESIDLGLVKGLKELTSTSDSAQLTELLQANHPVFLLDPLHDDLLYVYHAFGVHALDIAPILETLSAALQDENEDESFLQKILEGETMTTVRPVLSTFSVERKCSNPVIAVAIPNDVYLNYCILILTSAMRVTTFPLNMRIESNSLKSITTHGISSSPIGKSKWLIPVDGPPSYISLLGPEPYTPPSIVANPSGLPSLPTLSLPPGSKELMLTPDTLRFMGKTVAEISSQVNTLQIAYRAALAQINLQKRELMHQVAKCKEMEDTIEKLKGPARKATSDRFVNIQAEQKDLLARLDGLLQALMRKASPELSEHESKWFEELKRMKEDILGRGRYDDDSLVSRTRMLEKEYARVLPPLRAIAEKEFRKNKKQSERSESLGFSQAFEYGQRSSIDQTHISAIEKEIIKLATKLGIVLGPPPSSTE